MAGDSSFCDRCGTRIPSVARQCSSCGAAIPQAARFCDACGAPVDVTPDRRTTRRFAVAAAVLCVVALVLTGTVVVSRAGREGSTSRLVSASAGGVVTLDGVAVEFAPGSLPADSVVSLRSTRVEVPLPGATPIGGAFDVDTRGTTLRTPATVRLPLLPKPPADAQPALAFVARFNENARSWERLGSRVEDGSVIASVDHFTKVRAFWYLPRSIADFLVDRYVALLRMAGIRANPPQCGPSPAGVSLDVVPALPTSTPGSPQIVEKDLLDAVLACVDGMNAEGVVTLKVVNNRPYSLLLDLPFGSTSTPAPRGSLDEDIARHLESIFNRQYFLPPGAEGRIGVTVPAGTTVKVRAASSQLALAMDAAAGLVSILPITARLDALSCVYKTLAVGGGQQPATLDKVPSILGACLGEVLDFVGRAALGVTLGIVGQQVHERIVDLDTKTDRVLGGGNDIVLSSSEPQVAPMSSSTTSSSTSTSATTTATTSTTVAPLPILLAADGLGALPFGTGMDQAIAAITATLGPPDHVGAWKAPFCESAPPSGGGRMLMWGELSVRFSDGGTLVGNRREHVGEAVLWGYTYGGSAFDPAALRTIAPRRSVSLRTPSGATIGSTGTDLDRIYGTRATFYSSDPSQFPGPRYIITTAGGDRLYIQLDSDSRRGRVTMISAGGGCGE